MLTPDQVMPLLLLACPSFTPAWDTIADENLDPESPAGRLGYLDASEFVRHLVRLQLAGTVSEFPGVFEAIERMIIEGDPYVENLAVVGYLEGLQMRAVTDHGIDPEVVFRPYFGPTANHWWERINRFWAGDPMALRDDRD